MLLWMRKITQGIPASASDALKHWGKVALLELESCFQAIIASCTVAHLAVSI